MRKAWCSILAVTGILADLIAPVAANQFTDAVASAIVRTLSYENLIQHKVECAFVAFIIAYTVLAISGTNRNRQIATTWFRVFGAADSVLARNFSMFGGLGSSESSQELCWKDSADTYKCYASGRRYCSGALLTLKLRARQDIFTQIWYLVSPTSDELQLDVFMSESVMPQTVLLLGQPKLVKALLRESPHSSLAKVMQVSKERVPGGWNNDRVVVAAEHPALFYELLNTEPALARGLTSRWLKTAVLSSEVAADPNPPGPRLSFTITLPPAEQAEELNTLLSCAFLLVDLLGSYKVSPEMKKKSAEARQLLQQQQAKKGSQDRQEQKQLKRMEKLEAERAKARAAGPAALAKFEEKMQNKMRQKEMRKRMVRM